MERLLVSALLIVAIAFVSAAHCANLSVVVLDSNGEPVVDAVVYANPTSTGPASFGDGNEIEEIPTATVSQIDQEFVPYVTAIRVGTAVRFPNHDEILHNVYSFSNAKKFQLPLYKDEPPEPLVFDNPGVVVLGCNIHDWMVAYLYVTETSYFGRTDRNGQLALRDLPAGTYDVGVWHPLKKKRGSTLRQGIRLDADTSKDIEFAIGLKPEWRPQRPTDAS